MLTASAYTSGAVTINVAAGEGALVRAGDVIRNMRTGEALPSLLGREPTR